MKRKVVVTGIGLVTPVGIGTEPTLKRTCRARAAWALLLEAGEKAKDIQDSQMVNIQSNYIQVDEAWSYVGKKQKKTTALDDDEMGDQYVYVALDSETKLSSRVLGRQTKWKQRPLVYG